jgi:hypothetical protein
MHKQRSTILIYNCFLTNAAVVQCEMVCVCRFSLEILPHTPSTLANQSRAAGGCVPICTDEHAKGQKQIRNLWGHIRVRSSSALAREPCGADRTGCVDSNQNANNSHYLSDRDAQSRPPVTTTYLQKIASGKAERHTCIHVSCRERANEFTACESDR